MEKLLSLLKASMSQDMNLFKTKSKNETKIKKMFLPIVLALIVMFAVGSYAFMFAEQLAPMNLTHIVLTIFIMLTSLLTLIEGIYKSQGILFEAKDNDLLFSLPISKAKIFFTRVFKLITFQFLYNSLFVLPAMIVYTMFEKTDLSYYLVSIIMLLLLPIIPTIVASIIGYIIKGVTTKFKSRNIMQVILTTFMLLLIFYASFNMQGMIEKVIQNANSISDVIEKIYYPAGLYINLVQNFNILDLIILIAINIIPFIIFVYIASILYFKIISKLAEKGNDKKVKWNKNKTKIYKKKTQLSALVGKEIKRFFSSPVFIINAGFAMVLMVVVTIAICINFDGFVNDFLSQNEIGISLNQIKAYIPKIFYGFVIFTSCMTSITSSMISLERKSFNITKSLPVPTEKILLAKILTSNIISIPVILICDTIFFVVFKVEMIDIAFILLASIIVPVFTALVGILMNLKYPKMDATSDTEIVKQSMSSTISVFIGICTAMVAIAIIAIGSLSNINLFITLELLVFNIIDLVLWNVLKKYGVKKFKEINV